MFQSSNNDMTFAHRYALCVGVGTYPNLVNHDLRYAIADATIIAERLADPKRGDFAVTLLTEPSETSKATLDEAMETLLSASDRQAEDLIVIYFSSHGNLSAADNTFCLLPSNATLQADGTFEPTTLVSIYDIAKWFSRAKPQNIVMLLDVCHSGGAGAVLQHLKLNLSAELNYFIIGGARQDQFARQSSLLQHGLFTHCLLRAFEQPPTKDGWLTISQIHNFVADEISWLAKGRPIQIQGLSVSVYPNLSLMRNPGYPELSPLPPLWNVPLQRNPFFTGQENLLSQLASILQSEQKTALTQPQAINGLGGIGKTQLALEYAYRHRQDYHAVLWGRADTRENLISTFVGVAHLLDLPQKDEKDQEVIVQAVKTWLMDRSQWLFILDNAEELALVKEFIPPAFRGHLLLTTRAQAMGGLAHKFEVEVMHPESGALLLLRRSGLVALDASFEVASSLNVAQAKEITEELGGLPLALDQAGAYIEETQCSLSEYQAIYRTRRAELLEMRGGLVGDHPEPVTTTWSLSFQKVEEQNPAAADLLRFCAYLAPDAIPEEIITRGVEHLGPSLQPIASDPFALNQAIAVLSAYSLIRRNATTKTVSIHRLVQAVLQDSMPAQAEQQWKRRVILTVKAVCPAQGQQIVRDVEQRDAYERWLPHALICTTWMGHESMWSREGAQLLDNVGYYLQDRARYYEAEPVLARALEIREHLLGSQDPATAGSLNNLGLLYYYQEKYARAEALLTQALTIDEQQLETDHFDSTNSLNNLAILYRAQGKYAQAEPLYQRALKIREQWLGTDHPATATSLNNLALLYLDQKKYAQVELLLMRALKIREQQLGPDHPEAAEYLSNLALLYLDQKKYTEAEPLSRRALVIYEQQLGNHPRMASYFGNLAAIYWVQKKYTEAEPLLKRALAIYGQQSGSLNPTEAAISSDLADLYRQQRRYTEAELLYQRALTIYEQQLGSMHSKTQTVRGNYTSLLRKMRYDVKRSGWKRLRDLFSR